jgi:hypothetical protein
MMRHYEGWVEDIAIFLSADLNIKTTLSVVLTYPYSMDSP